MIIILYSCSTHAYYTGPLLQSLIRITLSLSLTIFLSFSSSLSLYVSSSLPVQGSAALWDGIAVISPMVF